MAFYEVLKLLIEEPGKHKFNRKSWSGFLDHENIECITSIEDTIYGTQLALIYKNGLKVCIELVYTHELLGNDWYEV